MNFSLNQRSGLTKAAGLSGNELIISKALSYLPLFLLHLALSNCNPILFLNCGGTFAIALSTP